VRIDVAQGDAVHSVELPAITVYADQDDADRAPDPVEIEGISFLKEQQWKIPFRVVAAAEEGDVLTIPESALITRDDETFVFVMLAGETFERRAVHVRSLKKGVAEVDRGLSAGDHVVGVGAEAVEMADAESNSAESHGHDHDAHDHGGHDHAEHADEHEMPTLRLTPEQLSHYQIELAEARRGSLSSSISVPGDIKINSDRLAHIVPRMGGIVREVYKNLGDGVTEGETLALIESRELGDLKADYLAAGSRYSLARSVYDREKRLYNKKISSKHDYLVAKNAFSEADVELHNARQKLLTIGLTKEEISRIASRSEGSFATIRVTAPFAGVVIDKHVVLGEAVDGAEDIFEIADLSTIWVDLKLTQEEVTMVKVGQEATIIPAAGIAPAKGVIAYVSPLIDSESRTAIARVILDNLNGQYRPGMFVQGLIQGANVGNTLLVPASSIQHVQDRPCVFVKSGAGFELREVLVGVSDKRQVEITKGLAAGDRVVIKNAFHLKAEFEKQASGGPAGHGHAH